MKKTIYLFIISMVTIICVIVGTVMHSGSFISFHHSSKSDGEYEKLDSFSQVIVSAEVMELTIKPGNEYGITCDYTPNLEVEYKVTNGKLYIDQKKMKKVFAGNNNCHVLVEVPYDTSLELVDANSDVGDVKISDLTIKTCTGKVDVGELHMEGCLTEDLEWKNDTGDIKITDCSFQNLDLKTDIGEIKVESKNKLDQFDADIKTNLGEVKVNGENYGRKYRMKGSEGTIKIKTDVGDVRIED